MRTIIKKFKTTRAVVNLIETHVNFAPVHSEQDVWQKVLQISGSPRLEICRGWYYFGVTNSPKQQLDTISSMPTTI